MRPPQTSHGRPFRWFANRRRARQDVRVAVEELSARSIVLPRRLPRARDDGLALRFARGLSRALAVDRPTGLEWAVAIIGLFLVARTPVLFLRARLVDVFGRRGPVWQDDLVVTCTLASVQILLLALAMRRTELGSLLRQKILLAFCIFAWSSTAWSVEPAVTARRAALLIGTAGVGWYLGSRFSVRQQPGIVAGVAAVGVLASAGVTAIWPELGTRSGRAWSGIYVNRNTLALAMSMGLLAIAFLLGSARRGRRWVFVCAGAVFAFWLIVAGSRTGPVALVATLGICCLVLIFRNGPMRSLTPFRGALAIAPFIATAGLFVSWHWATIVVWLGRDPTLTRRTGIWQLSRWFSELNPWHGWGLEAIWTNRRALGQAQASYGAIPGIDPLAARLGGWPYAAHNGYFEILLGVGRVGLLLLVCFLAVSLWRAFRYAWQRQDVMSLWPFALIVFAVVVNFSESLFISSEALWALVVAAVVGVTETARKEGN